MTEEDELFEPTETPEEFEDKPEQDGPQDDYEDVDNDAEDEDA